MLMYHVQQEGFGLLVGVHRSYLDKFTRLFDDDPEVRFSMTVGPHYEEFSAAFLVAPEDGTSIERALYVTKVLCEAKAAELNFDRYRELAQEAQEVLRVASEAKTQLAISRTQQAAST